MALLRSLYHNLLFICPYTHEHALSRSFVLLRMKIAFDGEYAPEVIYKWLRTFVWRFFAQQFKRSCLPDGPKVGSVAVSPRGDLRMPSDAAVQLWIKQLDDIREEYHF